MEAGTECKSRIVSLATAVPGYGARQDSILAFMDEAYNEPLSSRKLKILFHNSGIENRYSVIPDFKNEGGNELFHHNNGTPFIEARMEVYRNDALPLAIQAIGNAMDKVPSVKFQDITHLITVTCTGLYAPGLDAGIIAHCNLRNDIFHTSLNFLGCNAAFPALKLADTIVRSDNTAKVLVVCVELCTIHFQPKCNNDNLLSNTIFGDGAAALLVVSKQSASADGLSGLGMNNFYSTIQKGGKDLMGWNLTSVNFEMILNAGVPEFLGSEMDGLKNKIAGSFKIQFDELKHWAIHPGGKRILDEIKHQFRLSQNELRHSYEVLKKYGNMSSPTVLFVIASILEHGIEPGDSVFAMGFGPGISIDSALMTYELA
jgi:predicted naringenin-chalcone synthase